jgi:hypothetical protein
LNSFFSLCLKTQKILSKGRIPINVIDLGAIVSRKGETYGALSLELDVSSCGRNIDEAQQNLKTAVRLFVKEAEKIGTLEEILRESGFVTISVADILTSGTGMFPILIFKEGSPLILQALTKKEFLANERGNIIENFGFGVIWWIVRGTIVRDRTEEKTRWPNATNSYTEC